MPRIQVKVDGIAYDDEVESRLLLVHYLRERLGLTGTNVGCDTSNCGACTVMMDGHSVKSCTVLAAQVDGSDITTIQGLVREWAAAQRTPEGGPSDEWAAAQRTPGGGPSHEWAAQPTPGDGSSDDGDWHPLQRAFHTEHGLQCGYCTPGMIMASVDLLAENPNPSDEEIRHGLEGNLCRCTGYQNIVRAVRKAAETMAGDGTGSQQEVAR
ncbi:MAG: (2Fe-2S)-binding protein [Actinomycetota bacterium]|nr:(2Fe-2S)-binding protein [Actinomycetota bacterium]